MIINSSEQLIIMNRINIEESQKKVLLTIYQYEKLNWQQLIQLLNLPQSNIRSALRELSQKNILIQIPNMQDMRSKFYMIHPNIHYSQSFFSKLLT